MSSLKPIINVVDTTRAFNNLSPTHGVEFKTGSHVSRGESYEKCTSNINYSMKGYHSMNKSIEYKYHV